MNKVSKIIGISGHRTFHFGCKTENEPKIITIKSKLLNIISEKITAGATTFIVGGALGVDQWAAEIIIQLKQKLKLTLIIAKPFSSQDSYWNDDEKQRLRNIEASADKIVLCSDDPPSKHKYHIRNRWIVDQSDELIAVYRPSVSGGTAMTINYAKTQGKPVSIISP